jgi:hypothetical protein
MLVLSVNRMHFSTFALRQEPDLPVSAPPSGPHSPTPAAYPVVRIASIHRVDDALPVLGLLRSTDWSHYALSLEDPWHQEVAAQAVSHGAIACHPVGSVFMFTARPDHALIRYVNQVKGLAPDQPVSVLTTPRHLPDLFDWSALPVGLDAAQLMSLFDTLQELGPMAFRGPASRHLPPYLTDAVDGIRTVQVVSAGHACRSTPLLERIFMRIPQDYLYATSASRADAPVHHRFAPLQAEFGSVYGLMLLRPDNASAAPSPDRDVTRTEPSVLAFHNSDLSETGLRRLVLERQGSLALDEIAPVAKRFGFEVGLAPGAIDRLTERRYYALRGCP